MTLTDLTVTELAGAIARREVTSEEVCRAALARIIGCDREQRALAIGEGRSE